MAHGNSVLSWLLLMINDCCFFPLSFMLSLGHFSCFWPLSVHDSTPSKATAVLCMDITSAIQQKVDNVFLLPKAIEPYPSGHRKPLKHLEMCVCLFILGWKGGLIYWENKWEDRGGGGQWEQAEGYGGDGSASSQTNSWLCIPRGKMRLLLLWSFPINSATRLGS